MSWLKKLAVAHLLFFILTSLTAVIGLALYIPRFGVHPLEPIFTGVFIFVVAMAVAGGYHRYFSHKTYECHPLLKIIMLIFGAAGFQQSALVWSSDHRKHHRFGDTDKDPYSIQKGFWWAHIGWVFAKDHPNRSDLLLHVKDLSQDKWVLWQDKYWIWIGSALSLGLPLALGFIIGRPMGMLLWAGVLRIVLTLQSTFTINSIAHQFGVQPYSDENSGKDVWWLGPILCGENYHNYHHSFPNDYRNGIRWYHWDPAKWAIWLLSHTPLVAQLRRTPSHLILKAKVEMKLKRVKENIDWKDAIRNVGADLSKTLKPVGI